MRTLINRLEAEGAFDAEAIRLLVGAFDGAWEFSSMTSGAPFAQDRYRPRAREILASTSSKWPGLGNGTRRNSCKVRCSNWLGQI